MSSDSPDKSYDYLLRCCSRVIEHNRLAWARDELSKSIAQGGRAFANKGKGRGGDKDEDKKGKGGGSNNKRDKAAGDHRRDKSNNRKRSQNRGNENAQ